MWSDGMLSLLWWCWFLIAGAVSGHALLESFLS